MSTNNAVNVSLSGQSGTGSFVGSTSPALSTPSTDELIHTGDTNNKIVFGTDTQSFETGGSSRLDISDTGVRMGAANARVTTILDEDTMASDSATALATQQSIKAYVDAQSVQTSPSSNVMINGDFSIAQRGTSFTSATTTVNNDDTYLLDRWILLSDGNDIVDVSQELTIKPTGANASIKLDIETANKKAGIFQVAENLNSNIIIGSSASLSFKAEKVVGNATVDKLRAAIVSWSGTKDAVTSDIVSAWNAEGTDPTLVANWTYENVPSNLVLTDSWQTFTIENISIDTASAANVGVFIWIDNSDGTVGDLVYISQVKLQYGNLSTDFFAPLSDEQLNSCLRYYQRFEYNSGYNNARFLGNGQAVDTADVIWHWIYPNTMRTSPTLVTSGADAIQTTIADSSAAASTAITSTPLPSSIQIRTTRDGAGLVAGNCSSLYLGTNEYISLDAEL